MSWSIDDDVKALARAGLYAGEGSRRPTTKCEHPRELAERYAPLLVYDLLEPCRAGNVADVKGHLHRADGTSIPVYYAPSALSAERYLPDNLPVREGDHLALTSRDCGDGCTYANVCEDHGRVWLSYWWFYGFNGFHWATGGLHDGDWENVLLRLHSDAASPDLAVYAQHRGAQVKHWSRVHQRDGHPVVYVALGSHASHFRRGFAATGLRPAPAMPVELVDVKTHPWLGWRGRWGASVAGGRWADSPRGPAFHRQWSDPLRWMAQAAGL